MEYESMHLNYHLRINFCRDKLKDWKKRELEFKKKKKVSSNTAITPNSFKNCIKSYLI